VKPCVSTTQQSWFLYGLKAINKKKIYIYIGDIIPLRNGGWA